MWFTRLVDSFDLSVDGKDINFLIGGDDYNLLNPDLNIILKHFGYDARVFGKAKASRKGIVLPIDDLIRKICKHYDIPHSGALITTAIEITKLKNGNISNINEVGLRDINLDLSEVNPQIKRAYIKRKIADLELLRCIITDRDRFSLCSYEGFIKERLELYIAYQVMMQIGGLDESARENEEGIKCLQYYIKKNKNLLLNGYSFTMDQFTPNERVFQIYEIEEYLKRIKRNNF